MHMHSNLETCSDMRIGSKFILNKIEWIVTHACGGYKCTANQIVPSHALCSGLSTLYIYKTAGKGAEASSVSNTLDALM